MSQGLPLREDVPISETWDLTDLFKDDQQYYESIDALVQQANQFHHTYATTLNSIEQINTALAELENILIALDRLSNYAELRLSVDTSNIEAQVLSAKLSTTYGKIVSQLSFVESEILELPEEILQQLEKSCPYQHYIKQLIKQKPFQLSVLVEQLLAILSPTLNSPYDLYGTTKMLDIHSIHLNMMVRRTLSTMLRLKMIMKIIKILSLDVKVSKSFSDGFENISILPRLHIICKYNKKKLKLIYVGLNRSSIIYYIVKK